MPNPTVTLTRCSDYSQAKIAQAIAAQFELLGGLEKFVTRGDTVLLKPNFIAPRSRRCATQTDPAVLLETARLLKDFGARPFIGDSPAWGNVFTCIKALKLEEALKKISVPVKQLNKPKKCRIGTKNIKVGISSIALDADVIINMPKFKTHQQLVTTFAVKNMFGCVSGKRKALWHFAKGKNADEFCELLIEIYKFLNPALTIIDAVTVMDGPGPIRGRARPLGYLLGGTEPFALEVICSRLVNIKPENVPIIKTAKQMGLNCPDADSIKILGDSLPQNPCTDFELPQLIPIRFSLPHVCKSICKQILLLAKAAVKTKPQKSQPIADLKPKIENRKSKIVNRKSVNILGIETSCDETAAAVVTDGRFVKSSIIASQTKLHEKYGGVVPEIASRAHIEKIYPVITEAIEQANVSKDDIDAIAVANQPGLTVALIVGVTAAKTLALVWEKPLIAINHLHAHLQSALLEQNSPELPAIALIVSGGHTCLYDYHSPLQPMLLGSTIDDAAGEAFDKVASILKLSYPGGPAIEKAAKHGNPKAIKFPISMLGKDSLDFSFSGIKTAVLYYCHGKNMKAENKVDSMTSVQIADIAASFQAAVVDVLVKKTQRAAEKIGAKTILLGGGVAANMELRTRLQQMCDSMTPPKKLLVAPKPYCTDNAVMVASLAYYKFKAGLFADLTLEPTATG